MSDFDPALDDWDETDVQLVDIETRADRDEDNESEELTDEQVAEILAAKVRSLGEPKPYHLTATKKIIAVVDTETDPFAEGVVVAPFTVGFYTGDRYVDFWGDDCVQQFFDYLKTQEDDYLIYAHNGGKFDFFFFLKYLDVKQTPLIMGGRLVKINFQGQEFRDSYSIIPQPLSAYKKDDVDYNDFVRSKREANKAKILAYQKTDCIYTHELITGFHEMFGDKLTVASAALPMLNSLHGFERAGLAFDDRFRPYYFGGRNQCFKTGVMSGDWLMIDRTSMYPAVMASEQHPISRTYDLQSEITERTDFACIVAENDGCLPLRAENGDLDFTAKVGTFFATIHEIKAGLRHDKLKILRVKHAWAFHRKANFAEFVHKFFDLRAVAKENQELVLDILYKLCLNSPYGKFALNPRKFKQWKMTTGEVPQPQASKDDPNGWTFNSQSHNIFIWSRPSPRKGGFYNVATAASITGAARADLFNNIQLATNPVYCDTDSIICEGYKGPLEGKALGSWKLEATGDVVAIAGKKLYAFYNGNEVLKKASKGVRLSADEIYRVCMGEEVRYINPVPNFNLDGTADFVTRRINKTGTV